jgi:hypothetical protein
MFAVGHLTRRPARGRHLEQFRVQTHIGEEEDRLAVPRPLRPLHFVRHARRRDDFGPAPGGRHHEDLAVVVGGELLVGLRDEEHLRVVG